MHFIPTFCYLRVNYFTFASVLLQFCPIFCPDFVLFQPSLVEHFFLLQFNFCPALALFSPDLVPIYFSVIPVRVQFQFCFSAILIQFQSRFNPILSKSLSSLSLVLVQNKSRYSLFQSSYFWVQSGFNPVLIQF